MVSTERTTSTSNMPRRHGTRDKSVGWYEPTLESITEAQRDLFENYSHIPPEKVIPHIIEIVSLLSFFLSEISAKITA